MITKEEIENIIRTINEFSDIQSLEKLAKELEFYDFHILVNYLNNSYHNNGITYITDQYFDILEHVYSNRFLDEKDKLDICDDDEDDEENDGEDITTSIENDDEDEHTLSYPMPGMGKAYDDAEIKLSLKHFTGDKILLSSKLDGLSCILIKEKNGKYILFTKGRDKLFQVKGRDITYLLECMNVDYGQLSKLNSKIVLRGEIIIDKKHKSHFKNTNLRSQVSGLANGTKNIKSELLKYVSIVFYQIIHPVYSFANQFEQLKALGLTIPKHEYVCLSNINQNILRNTLTKYKELENYEIDGIIIADASPKIDLSDQDTKFKNHIFAFKENTFFANTEVLEVVWNPSINNKLIPVLTVRPVKLNGVEIKHVNGHNAAFLLKNNIGIGALISIRYSGDTSPAIDKIIKPSIFVQPNDSEWDENSTHLHSAVTLLETKGKLIQKFYKYFNINGYEAKSICAIIKTLEFNNNSVINDVFDYIVEIEKFFNTHPIKKLLGPTKDKIIINHPALFRTNIIPIEKLLIATNYFEDFNITTMNNILQSEPDIIQPLLKNNNETEIPTELYAALISIQGVKDITATKFINGLTLFLAKKKKYYDFFKGISFRIYRPKLKVVFSEAPGKDIYFKNFIDYFEEHNSVTKDVDYVITKRDPVTLLDTTKAKTAQKRNIPIISFKAFMDLLKERSKTL